MGGTRNAPNFAAVIKLVECPRDAMQGLREFIPTEDKIDYLNLLLQVGFDTLDFGSFVSPKAIPQMADTREVLAGLNLKESKSKLLAIIGNARGAEDAVEYEQIKFLGFPFSISETFQRRNLNSSIKDSLKRIGEIQTIARSNDKQLVVYISMGFGNPYDEPWSADIVGNWAEKLANMGIRTIALAYTIGVANPESISYLFEYLIPTYPEVEFGAHFHTTPDTWLEKIDAAYKAGCERYDGAIMGFGGCPMAKDDLTGNMATENILQYMENQGESLGLDKIALRDAFRMALRILPGADYQLANWLIS
jgi:hydroxymethylglutaryl-CoA lyase